MNNDFYRTNYSRLLIALSGIIFLILVAVGILLYEMYKRPIPQLTAVQPNNSKMLLYPYQIPNLLSDTIVRWTGKAATAAYTFDFVNYQQQINAVRSYFTPAGWADYQSSVSDLLSTIQKNQLFVNGIIDGTPVIVNQGYLAGHGYVWRIQIPFLVTYQSANATSTRRFYVIVTVARVDTTINPQAIGIDQFVMVEQ